jgi:hypothetical protein
MVELNFVDSKKWVRFSSIVMLGATVAIVVLTIMLYNSTDEMTKATNVIANFTERSLKIEEESKFLQLASIESQYEGFQADLDYLFFSIKKDDSPYRIQIKNNDKTGVYLKHKLFLTATCNVNSELVSIDQRIIDDEEITIKFEKLKNIEFALPDSLFKAPYVDSFGLRLTVVAHPNLSSGYIESASDNKVIHVQYVLSEDYSRWQPIVVSSDGGFKCGREPYGGDVNRAKYTDENDFLECNACK